MVHFHAMHQGAIQDPQHTAMLLKSVYWEGRLHPRLMVHHLCLYLAIESAHLRLYLLSSLHTFAYTLLSSLLNTYLVLTSMKSIMSRARAATLRAASGAGYLTRGSQASGNAAWAAFLSALPAQR